MTDTLHVPILADMLAEGKKPDVLFWVGCAGSFDDRAKKVSKAFVKLLNEADISFAVLGSEEGCTGDPARRSGNEFLFQMQAMQNIEVLNGYDVQRIVTTCPHCFNTLKNEYPELGGQYEVFHHSQFLRELLKAGKLTIQGGAFKGKRIVFHDPCYLGRINQTYEEKGDKDINIERVEEALATKPDIITTGCPFCKTMISDGLSHAGKDVPVLDIAEAIVQAGDLS